MTTEPESTFDEPRLNATEIRILGSLIEKQATSPETYTLTLNSLVTACNKKTSREPVMNLAESDVLAALEALADRGDIEPKVVAEAIVKFGINPEKLNPLDC